MSDEARGEAGVTNHGGGAGALYDSAGLAAVARAYLLAARAHADQTRKGQAGIPYVNHPCEVAAMVAGAGAPLPVVVAAVLHDVLEDSDVTADDLRESFGSRVAELVEALTNPPEWDELPKIEMKTQQARHIAEAGPDVRLIKLADQTSNLHDIAREPGAWEPEAAARYLEGSMRVVDACRGVHAQLEADFDAAAAHIRDIIELRR